MRKLFALIFALVLAVQLAVPAGAAAGPAGGAGIPPAEESLPAGEQAPPEDADAADPPPAEAPGDEIPEETVEAAAAATVATATDLQAAINTAAANGGGTVALAANLVLEAGQGLTVPAGGTVTLQSAKGGPYEIKRGESLPDTPLVTVGSQAAPAAGLVLQNVVLDGNRAKQPDAGAGLVLNHGSLEIKTGAVLRNNARSAHALNSGSAIHNLGTLTISGGSISGNSATSGGGVNNSGGTLTISGGSISGNSGSGVYSTGGTLTISGGSISSNSDGGVCNNGGTLTISGGSISGNSATSYGGGVYNNGGAFTISGGSISGNSTASNGGGVYTVSSPLTISGGSISGNSATGYGGGVYNSSGALTISGGSISGNSAATGGGVYTGGALALGSATITGNLAATGAELWTNNTVTLGGKPVVGGKAAAGGVWLGWHSASQTGVFTPDATAPLKKGAYLKIEGAGNSWYGAAGRGTLATGYDAANSVHKAAFAVDGDTLRLEQKAGDATVLELVRAPDDATNTTRLQELVNAAVGAGSAERPKTITLSGAEALAATLQIPEGAHVKLTGGTLRRASGFTGLMVQVGASGAINASLTLEHITLQGNTNATGEMLLNYGNLVLKTGAVLRGNQRASGSNGGAVYNLGSLEMAGGSITGNSATSGGAVYNLGSFEMAGGSITGNSATSSGGVGNAGRFEMTGGNITGNSAASNGGGVASINSFTMAGGSIAGNQAATGGGVNINGTFTMAGGSITGNSAADYGGGVNNNGGTFTLNGGSISGNSAASGAEVSIYSGAFNLGGKVQLGQAGAAGGVYLLGSTDVITISTSLKSGSLVVLEGADDLADGRVLVQKATAITAAEKKAFQLPLATWALDYGNDAKTTLEARQTTLQMKVNSPEAAAGTKAAPYTIVLEGEEALAASLQIPAGTYVKLTGGTLRRAPGFIGVLVQVGASDATNAGLTLEGITLEGNESSSEARYSELVQNHGSLVLKTGAALQNNLRYTGSFGGAVYNYGSFEMAGGSISGNSASSGGGVHNYVGGTLNMTGGSISGNRANNGGGVHNSMSGALNLSGGSISGNTASSGGGVFSSSSGTLSMTGGSISGNQATDGGGVFSSSSGTLSMTGGSISGNKASYGGGVYNNGGALNMTGGSISGNSATTHGGGVCSSSSGTLNLNGGSISGNQATNGGGVYNSSTLNLSGGSISGNTATSHGSGVYNSRTLTLTGGSVTGNIATSYGGGVYNFSGSTLTLTSGSISGNQASNGGGVYNNGGTLNLSGGSISGNTATFNGGGVHNVSTLNMTGGSISDNSAALYGGGVYNIVGTFTMAGGSTSGNSANSGGGVYNASGSTLTLSGGSISGNSASYGGGGVYNNGTLNLTGGLLGTPGLGGHAGNPSVVTTAPAPGSLFVTELTSGTVAVGSGHTLTPADAACFVAPEGYHIQLDTGENALTVEAGAPDTLPLYLDATRAGRVYPVEVQRPTEGGQASHTLAEADTPGLALAGWRLDHWNQKADGTGQRYHVGGTFTFPQGAASATLYAIWAPVRHSITYYQAYTGPATNTPYSANLANNPATYLNGEDTALNPPGAGPAGMAFAGWALVGDASRSIVTAISPAWRGDIELVATWAPTAEAPASLNPPENYPYSIQPGETADLAAPLRDAGNDLGETNPANRVYWHSSDENCITVDQNGLATAIQPPQATITVSRVLDGSKIFSFNISVSDDACTYFTYDDGTPLFGVSMQLGTAPHGPLQAADGTVNLADYLNGYHNGQTLTKPLAAEWESSNPRVATVSAAGLVTPVKAGTAVITATGTANGASASLTVTVLAANTHLEGIKLSKPSLALAVGKTGSLKASYTPAKPKLEIARWSITGQRPASAGAVVATVDQKGKVTAVAPGTATLALTAVDAYGTTQEASCTVTVTQPATGASLTASGLQNGELVLVRSAAEFYPAAAPAATVLPHDASDRSLSYSPAYDDTDPANAAKIAKAAAYYSTDTGHITAGGKDGTATLTVKTHNGKKASLKVRVVTPAAGATLVDDTPFALESGKTKKLAATLAHLSINGQTKKPSSTKFTWHSSDSAVATVDKNGKVKAMGAGTATITVMPDGSYYNASALGDSVTVTVSTPVKSLKIDQKAFQMQGGASTTLTASANGGQAVATGVSWSAAKNSGVLVVHPATGVVTTRPVTKNTAVTVTATANGKKASVKITLTPDVPLAVQSVKLKKPAPAVLRSGKNHTPALTIAPSKAGNKNMVWKARLLEALDLDGLDVTGTTSLDKALWLDGNTGKLTGRLSGTLAQATVEVTGTLYMDGCPTGMPCPHTVAYTVRIVHAATKVTLAARGHGEVTKAIPLEVGAGLVLDAQTDSPSVAGFTWKSSNSKVARVQPGADGLSATVVTLRGGSATITATAADGSGKKASCKLTVTQPVRSVVLRGMNSPATPTDLETDPNYYGVATLAKGRTRTLAATLNTGYAAPKNKKLVYQVLAEYDILGNPVKAGTVVSLNAKNGKLKGLAKGSALVRVYSPECPANDYALTVPKKGKQPEEFCRNICVVQVE